MVTAAYTSTHTHLDAERNTVYPAFFMNQIMHIQLRFDARPKPTPDVLDARSPLWDKSSLIPFLRTPRSHLLGNTM